MIGRIFRKIRFNILELRVKSFDELQRALSLDQFNAAVEKSRKRLGPYYSDYVQNVSSPEMAASLELAAFMYTLCKIKQYKNLLDTGSGLSSFVFRLYASETPGVTVTSIDDDAAWLDKTKQYLQRHQLGVENMYTVQEFVDTAVSGFDCILHDMNFVEVRINYVELVVQRLAQSGVIIMDDVHKPDYRFALLKKLQNMNVDCYTVKSETFDSYGRYAFAVMKK